VSITRAPAATPTGADIDTSTAAAAAHLEDGMCWQLFSKEHSSTPKHFLVHAEAVRARTDIFDCVEKRTCMDSNCVAARSAAIDRYRDLQERVQREEAATSRAWRLASSSSAEIAKADTKAGFVAGIEIAVLLGWTSGSSALAVNEPLRWSAAGFLLVSVLAVIWAVVPRMPQRRTVGPGSEGVMNFGTVRRLPANELAIKLRDIDELVAATSEAGDLARIVHTKYVVLCWAVTSGAVGLILSVAAVAAG
jgi:Family of unknown function (DUF5706)